MAFQTLLFTNLIASTIAAPFSINPRAVGEVFKYSKANADDITTGQLAVDAYQAYQGDGSAPAGWPGMERWASFQSLWDANLPIMKQGCTWNFPGVLDSSDDEIGQIWDGIDAAARSTGVDHRFILAVIIQESKGCVRAPSTNNGVHNPGLMQSHNGDHTCNQDENVQTPCPVSEISGMIEDGTGGTNSGDGLAELLNVAVGANIAAGRLGTDGDEAQVFYQAARLYNSGTTDPNWNDLNDPNGATACYAMDIANRLTGWTMASSACA